MQVRKFCIIWQKLFLEIPILIQSDSKINIFLYVKKEFNLFFYIVYFFLYSGIFSIKNCTCLFIVAQTVIGTGWKKVNILKKNQTNV